ncbi:MAG TPA: biopolymer transporter ExbD [Pseudomonadales bacterium]|nr:biopolymer transporter ExbD [Pseudomonadales bacterium]
MPTHIPRRRASQDESEIDLTPMLDVVFIMLIFFVVTASFVKETGIHVARPQPQVGEAGKRNILLTVTAGNEIWLGERRVDARSVRATIERLHAGNPEAAVLIRAHEDSDTEVFAGIADQSREAGVYDVSISTFAD